MTELAPLLIGTAAVAALYSSVGHGGASGYLAVMTLLSLPKDTMKGTALVLNLLVAGFACLQYSRAKHWRASLFWPFVLASYLGARIKLPAGAYETLLAAAFIVVNSLSGLAGFLQGHGVVDWNLTGWMLGAAAVGGALGATWGAHRAPPVRLRQLLGGVLLIAAGKAAMALFR